MREETVDVASRHVTGTLVTVCFMFVRLSAAGLPWSLQHDDRPRPLGAAAEGQVRMTVPDTVHKYLLY